MKKALATLLLILGLVIMIDPPNPKAVAIDPPNPKIILQQQVAIDPPNPNSINPLA